MPRFLDTVPILKPKRSSFDLSNRYKFTARFANLIPAVCIPTLPTDHFSISAAFQARLAALINPIYDDITARVEWFFVPNEIIWKDWKAFITDNTDFNSRPFNPGYDHDILPTLGFFRGSRTPIVDILSGSPLSLYLTETGLNPNPDVLNVPGMPFVYDGSLADYLGVGLSMYSSSTSVSDASYYSMNALSFMAYQRVYMDYYIYEPTDSSLGDYWNVYNLSLNDFFEREGQVGINPYLDAINNTRIYEHFATLRNRAWNRDIFTAATANPVGDAAIPVDTSSGAFTIPQLNLARALYRLGYKDEIGGSRYDETILAQFGILPSAVEMHRAVFLGSSQSKVNVNGVVQTSATSDVSPQANMAGLGIVSDRSSRIEYTCHEHGYLIGLFSLMPRSTYAFSTRKDFLKSGRMDFAFPDLAGVGDDEIKICEVWDTLPSSPFRYNTFGYQQRYYEYKQILDSVHGGFRNFDGDLGAYTMARVNPSATSVEASFKLNGNFVRPNVFPASSLNQELSRPFADSDIYTGGYHYVCDFFADIRANRPIPEYSMPML